MLCDIYCFLKKIIINPDFLPDQNEYISIMWNTYALTTLNPRLLISDGNDNRNPYNNSFEELYDIIINNIDKIRTENFIEILQNSDNSIHHMITFKKRMKVIDHIFQYINDRRSIFIKHDFSCKISHYLAAVYFDEFAELFDTIVDQSIQLLEKDLNIQNLKSEAFSIIDGLIYLCHIAEEGYNNYINYNNNAKFYNNYSSIYQNYVRDKICLKIKTFFQKSLDKITLNILPDFVESFYMFLSNIKNISTRIQIGDDMYDFIISKFVNDINSKLLSLSSVEVIENSMPEGKYLRVFSFHSNSHNYLQSFFSKFLEDVTSNFEKEANVRNLGLKMLNFLDLVNKFKNNIYEDIFSTGKENIISIFQNEIVLKLQKTRFNQKFEFIYQIALSYIIDAFLKKGYSFKNLATENKMMQLLSFTKDKYVFILYHTNNLFYRIATQSTNGISKELSFINKIKEQVGDEAVQKAYAILENNFVQYKEGFYYICMKKSLAPGELGYHEVSLPSDYLDSIQKLTQFLKNKNYNYNYEWVHYLATANAKFITSKGTSFLTCSIGQVCVLKALVAHPSISFNELCMLVNIQQTYLKIILISLSKAKLIQLNNKESESKQGKLEISDSTMISLNTGFYKSKALIADNWEPKPIKISNISAMRCNQIKACIVKIMKAKRILHIQQLVEIVVDELIPLFPVEKIQITNIIKELEAGQYLELKGDSHIIYIE